MFKAVKKAELNQISLTGLRSLVLLGLFIVAPRSLKEIKQIFLELNIVDENCSDDTIRIDINTLKSFGCIISRPCIQNNRKYVLIEHPFNFPLNLGHIKVLKKIYNNVKINSNITKLIQYDAFFKKISDFVYDADLKEALLGISVLKYYDVDLIKKYIYYCKNKYILNLYYHNPSRSNVTLKNIIALNIIHKNDKVYLYGYDIDKKNLVTLKLNRIKSILSKSKNENNVIPKGFTIKYKLYDYKNVMLEKNEVIIETFNDYIIVEAIYYNDFYAMQRVLSLKEKCVVIVPKDFRKMIISKLKEMSQIYEK